MCAYGTTVTRLLPDFVQRSEQRIHDDVQIDACLETTVDALWAAGVVTRSVCCGHGKGPGSIVVHQRDATLAHSICGDQIAIEYWAGDVLCEYSPDGQA